MNHFGLGKPKNVAVQWLSREGCQKDLLFLILSEKDGSGMDFFRKLSTALMSAARWGKHLLLLTGPGESGWADEGPSCGSSSSTSILQSPFTAGCSVSIGTPAGELWADDWPWSLFVSIALALLGSFLSVGESRGRMPPWYGWHFFTSH